MIGDALITIKRFIKQNTCIHDYRFSGSIPTIAEAFYMEKCRKCGREHIK